MRIPLPGRDGGTPGALAPWGVMLLCCLLATGWAARPDSPLDQLRASTGRAEGLLRGGETGADVQRLHGDIVAQLDALIALAEEDTGFMLGAKPGEKESKALKPGSTTAAPEKPAEESILPDGGWAYGRMRSPVELEGGWLPELPATQRKAIADAFRTGRLPLRYREVLREYNKRLAEGATGGG